MAQRSLNGNQNEPLDVTKPIFTPAKSEPPAIDRLVSHLNLEPHPEGGYYVLTDLNPRRVPNPFEHSIEDSSDAQRLASTSIFYLLSPGRPRGVFHRNKASTVHTLHRGRGRYVVLHADEALENGKTARVETFTVGPNLEKGERLQWVVDGGKFKASFLLPDHGTDDSEGLLISEVCAVSLFFLDVSIACGYDRALWASFLLFFTCHNER